jgi:hypothetical protein
MKNRALPIAATAILLFSAACSSKPFPVGNYKPAANNTFVSSTTFDFSPDGTWSSSTYDGKSLKGTYEISGDKLTLHDSKDGPCFGYPMTMSWKVSGETITFKNVQDTCSKGITFDLVGDWVPAK